MKEGDRLEEHSGSGRISLIVREGRIGFSATYGVNRRDLDAALKQL